MTTTTKTTILRPAMPILTELPTTILPHLTILLPAAPTIRPKATPEDGAMQIRTVKIGTNALWTYAYTGIAHMKIAAISTVVASIHTIHASLEFADPERAHLVVTHTITHVNART